MRFSQIFTKTKRQFSNTEETVGAKLLVKAGFISKLASGLYSFLPLGLMVLKKIKKVIGQELGAVDVVEILTPVLHPVNYWKESGRYDEIGGELWKIKNSQGDEFVLAMTAEEVFSEIVRNHLQSYKDLPLVLNQFQTKIRNELRPKSGLIRTKEFLMQDAYSFDADEKGLAKSHDKIFKAYKKIFERFGLKTVAVEADVGAMGGSASFEFMVKNKAGEDKIVLCEKCGYAANLEKAECLVAFEQVRTNKKEEKEKVKTPRMVTVEEVSEFLKTDEKNVLKTLVYKIKDKKGTLVIAVIRGDLTLNEKKLQNALGGKDFEMASEKDLEKAEMMPGFVSPIDLENKNIKVIADSSVKLMSNFIAGANERDYHLKGVNPSDLKIDIWTDLTKVKEGDCCKKCGGKLQIEKTIELGHTFKLGDKYSKAMKVNFTDIDGKEKSTQMGCYGIGLGRAMATIAEELNDERGLIWPISVAPFQIYLMNISDIGNAKEETDKLYEKLISAEFEVLYDDRDVSAGVKFADCDLIGVPIRIVASQKTLEQDSVEIKMRDSKKTRLVKISALEKELKKMV